MIQGEATDYLETHINGINHQCWVQNDLTHMHEPANAIGLPMCFALGFKFNANNINGMVMDQERVVHNQVQFEDFEFL